MHLPYRYEEVIPSFEEAEPGWNDTNKWVSDKRYLIMAARQRRLMTKETNNMNQEKIAALEEIIDNRYSNTAGMIVLKNGETQYEGYFNGCTAARRYWTFSRISRLKITTKGKQRYGI